jgi:hypothetical protein
LRLAQAGGSQIELAPGHPEQYEVVRGDTLWGIASMFLRDPWLWPEIWYVNPQVENPHLIYPGDLITLVYVDGRPQLRLTRGGAEKLSPRVRELPLEEAIPTIPYEAIEAFLARHRVVTKKEAERAPYILSTREGHLVAGASNMVYVRGGDFTDGALFHVIHVGEELKDPDDGDVVGYLGHHAGEGRIEHSGDPGTMLLTRTKREVLEGDLLFSAPAEIPLYFLPRAPQSQVEGRVIAVVDGTTLSGQYFIVVLNRGSRDGIEPGHVLSIYRTGEVVRDKFAGGGKAFGEKVRLPDEYAGELMVYRAEERISYAVIVRAENVVRILDTVRNPG